MAMVGSVDERNIECKRVQAVQLYVTLQWAPLTDNWLMVFVCACACMRVLVVRSVVNVWVFVLFESYCWCCIVFVSRQWSTTFRTFDVCGLSSNKDRMQFHVNRIKTEKSSHWWANIGFGFTYLVSSGIFPRNMIDFSEFGGKWWKFDF